MLTTHMKYVWIFIVTAVLGGVIWWAKSGEQEKVSPTTAGVQSTQEQDQKKEEQPSSALEEKKNKKIVNGMTIETIKEGAGEAITNGKTAVVDYVGKLTDGTVFDASARHGQPFAFPLGAGMVIKGWDQGVLGMKVGETRILTIPPELAYGDTGAGGVIPPKATLVFEVTLREIK